MLSDISAELVVVIALIRYGQIEVVMYYGDNTQYCQWAKGSQYFNSERRAGGVKHRAESESSVQTQANKEFTRHSLPPTTKQTYSSPF